ncbi:MAG TPA: ATP-binding protein [Streptosporangiaceae bacterium]|nr:ATP-binding protein [Streptosporangiaceae bacterium]
MTHSTDGTRGTLTLDPADLACDWPMRSHLVLGSLPTAPSCARLHTRLVLAEWGMSRLTEDAELCVSELTTNAVLSVAKGHPVTLSVASDHLRVLVMVWDDAPGEPVLSKRGEYAEDGRGLVLVDALAASWGVCPAGGGKAVWALLARHGASP